MLHVVFADWVLSLFLRTWLSYHDDIDVTVNPVKTLVQIYEKCKQVIDT